MSLPWAEAADVWIAPDLVGLGDTTVPCAGTAGTAAALDALAAATRLRGRRLRWVLDDAHVHYLLLDWPEGVAGNEEQSAYVRFRFQELCGPAAATQTHSWENARPGHKVLACACDAALLAQLADWARGQGVRVAGARGAWLAAYNRLLPALAGPAGAFGLWRGGRCTLGVWRQGDW
ncbi:MAG: hypothetical protein JNJ60_21775, partial [Rhodocyclaceae bacterium]|nr:hypothetical protein [Rhodocyclaceae bacterium]